MRFTLIWVSILIMASFSGVSQNTDQNKNGQEKAGASAASIPQYDVFNPMLDGDSVRLCNDRPCHGRIRDYYENGELKHKGFYKDGRLQSSYENYFKNGQLERKFQKKGSNNSAELKIYYKNGQKRSDISFYRGAPLEWTEFSKDGKKDFYERYDKSLEYIEERIFFHENGNKKSHIELQEEEERKFIQRHFYPDGTLKARGPLLHIPEIFAYKRHGEWRFYDENADLDYIQEYYQGEVVEEKEVQ
ncbi:MAG: hypothetical protein R6U19_09330 [Bacteroidales bacterium]